VSSEKLRPALANGFIIAANIVLFLIGLSGAVHRGSPLGNVLLYGFCHLSIWHLLVNMWLLWLFGNPVNRRLGDGYYVAVYLGTILALGLMGRWWIVLPMVGSSGAIYAVMLLAVLLQPRSFLNLLALAAFPLTAIIGLFASPKSMWEWLVRWQTLRVPLLAGLVVIPLLLVSELLLYGWNWATAAHVLGAVCGLIAALLLPASITLRRSELATA
jgi:membrane associated rhomboid family serine protease